MKYVLTAICLLSLCACSSMPSVQMSYGGTATGTSGLGINDDRLHHRAFYQDDETTPAWMKAAPRTNQ